MVSFNFMIEWGGGGKASSDSSFHSWLRDMTTIGRKFTVSQKFIRFLYRYVLKKHYQKLGKAWELVFCAIMRVLHDLGQFLPLPSGARASFFHEVLQLLLFARLFISKEEKERRSKKSGQTNEPGRGRRRGHMIS